MHTVPALRNRISGHLQCVSICSWIDPWLCKKTHTSFVHLLGVEKFLMYLYSICRIGSWNITIQPPWDLKGKNTSSPTKRFFNHVSGAHLVWYVFHSRKHGGQKRIVWKWKILSIDFKLWNYGCRKTSRKFSNFDRNVMGNFIFSAKSEAVFYHQHPNPWSSTIA